MIPREHAAPLEHAPTLTRERPRLHWLDVLVGLTDSELRVRYGRSSWRIVRWLLEPYALVGVYLALLLFVLDRSGDAPALSLACAVVPFQLVMMSVSNAMSAVTMRGSIILNMGFPRTLLPVSSVLTEAAAFGASLTLFPLTMAAYGVEPTPAILWLPLVLVLTLVVAVAFAYPASLFGLWFREMRPFAISFVRALFFLAPSLVPLSATSGVAYYLLRLNPLTGLFESYRDVLLLGQRPAAWQLVYPFAISAFLLAAFVPIYRREQRQFAKLVE